MTNIQEPTRQLTQRQKELLVAFDRLNHEGQRYSIAIIDNLSNVFPTGENIIPFSASKSCKDF